MWKPSLLLILICALLAPTSLRAHNPSCSGIDCFPKSRQVGEKTLTQIGHTHYTYWGFSVFDAVFYAENRSIVERPFLGKAPIALRLCYHRSMSREDFIESGRETVLINPTVQIAEIEPALKQIDALYTPMQKGDCYELTFTPGVGTTLFRNDISQGTIPGDEFGRAYFGIWLSEHSFSDSMTKELLGGIRSAGA